MKIFVISLIRTVTPAIVGALSSFLVGLGIELEPEAYSALTGFLFILFTGIYYALIRLLEEKVPQIGVLLGYPASPDSYSKGVAQELKVTIKGGPRHAGDYPSRLTDGPDHRA